MRTWWRTRQLRERRILVLGGALVTITLVYTLVWEPVQKDIVRNRAAAAEQRQTNAWMKTAQEEVLRLRAAPSVATPEGSLLAAMERSAKEAGLGEHITRMEPSGSDSIQMRLTNVVFDDLIAWLSDLQLAQGVTVTESTISATSSAGYVDATLALSR